MIERTLVLLKPDAVERNLVGEIISRFERVGLELVVIKLVRPSREHAHKHYGYSEEWFEIAGRKTREFYQEYGIDPGEELRDLSHYEMGKLVQKWNVEFIAERLVIAMVWGGVHAVEVVKKMVGSTYPHEALPGTIRGDYSNESPLSANVQQRAIRNLVHASGTPQDAEMEISRWFEPHEIHG